MDRAEAFRRQAASEFRLFRELIVRADVPACHALHLLQMAAEKLAKAVRAAADPHQEPRYSHVVFSKLTGALRGHPRMAAAMGLAEGRFNAFIDRARAIMREIDELHPGTSTAGVNDGPNVEYPWMAPTPAGAATWEVPAEFTFAVLARLRSSDGADLLKLISLMLRDFDRLFR